MQLGFFALRADQDRVLDDVLAVDGLRLLETYSEPDRALRVITASGDVADFPQLSVFAEGSGPEPLIREYELNDGRRRSTVEGWGLIQLLFLPPVSPSRPGQGRVAHNTPVRAERWSGTYPELGSPQEWDWPAVAAAGRRIAGVVRRLSVAKEGRDRVLPAAAVAMGISGAAPGCG